MLTIATLALAGFSQTYEVIDSKITDPVKKEKVQIYKELLHQLTRKFKIRMMSEDRLYDSIYVKSEIDALIAANWSLYDTFVGALSDPDTIIIEKINNKYYMDGDTTQQSLDDERVGLIMKYNRLQDTYGELVTYNKDFIPIKERFDKLQDWLDQIQSQ